MKGTGTVIVVGGGISGIQSSLDLADAGFKVFLIENKPYIGGVMAKLDKTFPTNDCAMCILSPKLVAVQTHPNIELLTYTELLDFEGESGNFTVTLKKKARYVDEEKCTGCERCSEFCPVEISDEYNQNTAGIRNINCAFPQAVPKVARVVIETCIMCGSCELVCEAGAVNFDQTDEVITLDAGAIILSPGYETFDPSNLTRYRYDDPDVVTSLEFERMLSASGPTTGHIKCPSTGKIPKNIAFIQCVGSRDKALDANYCSSVCCTYAVKEAVLVREHNPDVECKIFYMDMRTHGKGFDEFFERARSEYGVKFVRGMVPDVEKIGEDTPRLTYENENGEVVEENFDLVVLSVGFRPPEISSALKERLNINRYGFMETEEFRPMDTNIEGVYACGAFLEPKDIPDSVSQASGAASRAASRLSENRWAETDVKSYPEERDVSGEEPRIGVFVCHCGVNISSVVDVPAVVEYAKGLPHVVFSTDHIYSCSQDTQVQIKEEIEKHGLNRVVVASCSPRTHEALFQETMREAGQNPYLFEMANIRDHCSWVHRDEPEAATEKAKDLVRMSCSRSALLEPLSGRSMSITKAALIIGGGISGMTAALELAGQGIDVSVVEKEDMLGGNLRWLHRTLTEKDVPGRLQALIDEVEGNDRVRVFTGSEVVEVSGYIGNFKSKLSGSEEEIEHGIIIVATGGSELKPSEYLYGSDRRVITQLELESKLEDGLDDIEKVVMIQCVGSRNSDRPYCSKVCCSEAVKNALTIKEKSPDTEVYVLYRDMRTPGFSETYYEKAASQGVIFIRYEEGGMPEVSSNLEVTVRDQVLGADISIESDLLVLSTAVVPSGDNRSLSQLLKVPLDSRGFFLEAHVKLNPLDFATEGIFLCGTAHYPKSIEESISQACGAASRAMTILSRSSIVSDSMVSVVDETMCRGCGTCVEVCEYGAPEIMKDSHIARINEVLCRGCGSCAVSCCNGAITMRHFTGSQILTMVESALKEMEF